VRARMCGLLFKLGQCATVMLLLCTFAVVNASERTSMPSTEGMVLTMGLVRHGARAPVQWQQFPTAMKWNTSNVWKCGGGGLTPNGAKGSYQFGQNLREWLVKPGFLNDSFAYWQVNATSLGAPREQLTTTAMLMGLYPAGSAELASDGKDAIPGGVQAGMYQNFPNTLPSGELLDSFYKCPAYEQLLNEKIASETFNSYEADKQGFFRNVERITGVNQPTPQFTEAKAGEVNRMSWWNKPLNAATMFSIGATWSTQKAQGIEMSGKPSQAMLNITAKMQGWYMEQKFNTPLMAKLGCGTLLNDMYNSMTLAVYEWNIDTNVEHPMDYSFYPKLKTYCASEMTQACMLTGLGVFDGVEPAYGSAIWFNLYNRTGDLEFCEKAAAVNPTLNDFGTLPGWFNEEYKSEVCHNRSSYLNYEVQLWYGTPYSASNPTLQLPLTNSGFGCTEPCTLKSFASAIKPLVLPVHRYEAVCNVQSTAASPGPPGAPTPPVTVDVTVPTATCPPAPTPTPYGIGWMISTFVLAVCVAALLVYAYMMSQQLADAKRVSGVSIGMAGYQSVDTAPKV